MPVQQNDFSVMRTIRKHKLLHCLLAIASCSMLAQAQSFDFPVRSPLTNHAFQAVSRAKIFNLGGFGIILGQTTEEKAFRAILSSPDSELLFNRLLGEGNGEGQLYALYGLYLRDRDTFKTQAARLKQDDGPPARWEQYTYIEKGKVLVGIGCVSSEQERKTVIQMMEQGDFDEAFKKMTNRTITH